MIKVKYKFVVIEYDFVKIEFFKVFFYEIKWIYFGGCKIFYNVF